MSTSKPETWEETPLKDGAGVILDHLFSTTPAVEGCRPGKEELEVVIYLGHCPHGGAGDLDGFCPLNGYGRRYSTDPFDLGPIHPGEKLAGIGGEGLHIPPLPFGIKGLEGQTGLPRARDPGDGDEPV